MYLRFFLLFNCYYFASAWHPCPLNDPTSEKLSDNVIIKAECMYLTSPLEWNNFNPNTFNGQHYNGTREIAVTDLHMKRLFLSTLPASGSSTTKHMINYWLVNGGGGAQAGMEPFGISTLKQIVANSYQQIYPETFPVMYLFQYRGAGMSKPSIHCHTATNWIDCAKELINTTVPSSRDESLRIIHAISNQHIAQDLQYQIQYSINQSQSIARTSTYIYALSQGTGIVQYYLSMQSINNQSQEIDGMILDGVMSIKNADAFRNQMKSINDRFYLYLSKCQSDFLCSKAFHLVVGTDEDILIVALKLQMLFLTNLTDVRCTYNFGLTSWNLFTNIANQIIETISVRPLAAILIARISRCSTKDQQDLSKLIPTLIVLAQQTMSENLIDSPDAYPNDGNVLSITTIWSDFVGSSLEENFKTNPEFYNEFCRRSNVVNEFYMAPTGPFPICTATEISKEKYVLPQDFRDILYSKNPRYWDKFEVNSNQFRSVHGGVLLLNGDLDFNSPMFSAQQVQEYLKTSSIPSRLIGMQGLAHVTSVQSHTKKGGFQSTTCTDQIVAQFLYGEELNLSLSTIDASCSRKENLIGIDWFAENPIINQTINNLFAGLTSDYWGINMSKEQLAATINPLSNQSQKYYAHLLLIVMHGVVSSLFLF